MIKESSTNKNSYIKSKTMFKVYINEWLIIVFLEYKKLFIYYEFHKFELYIYELTRTTLLSLSNAIILLIKIH